MVLRHLASSCVRAPTNSIIPENMHRCSCGSFTLSTVSAVKLPQQSSFRLSRFSSPSRFALLLRVDSLSSQLLRGTGASKTPKYIQTRASAA